MFVSTHIKKYSVNNPVLSQFENSLLTILAIQCSYKISAVREQFLQAKAVYDCEHKLYILN